MGMSLSKPSLSTRRKWLAWHQAWYAALWRSAAGERPVLSQSPGLPKVDLLRPELRQSLLLGLVEKAPRVNASSTAKALQSISDHLAALSLQRQRLEGARKQWFKACSAGALGNRPQALFAAELLSEAAGAVCRHVA